MSLTARPTPAGRIPEYAPGISAPYGFSLAYKNGKVFHHGQDYFWLSADIAGSRKVYAAGSGTVTRVFWTSTMGGMIEISHGSFSTRYNHMPKGSSRVKVGDKVTTNTYLGPMGNAGTAAAGQYHLHFEVWLNGTRVDPAPYFSGTAGEGGTPITPTERNDNVTTLFYKQDSSPTLYALAGESPGTSANWLETTGVDFATKLAQRHGSAILLSPGTWDSWKSRYTEPLSVSGGTASVVGASKADVVAEANRVIAATPTAVQNGAAARAAIVKE